VPLALTAPRGDNDADHSIAPERPVLKQPLVKYWDYVRSSFWFVPSLMAAGAIALAFVMVTLDETLAGRWIDEASWAYTGGSEGASAVLQTIAGSMITIAGVVFSLTLVALSLASSQFGPRLLHNFMRDRTNQLVLGTFIATFLYCLLVLRTIRFAPDDGFVPHLSVTLGVVFALASLWVLIYFIHHVSVSIQADEVIARVARDLTKGVERIFPGQIGRDAPRADAGDPVASRESSDSSERDSRPVAADDDGYLQVIDGDALLDLAKDYDVVLELVHRPGHYIVRGATLAHAVPGKRIDAAFSGRLNAAFGLGDQRTPSQDIEHAVLQLVEIAVRALSPGVNDPFTAIACVDRLGSGLCRVAQREMPSSHRCDDDGTLRVVAPPITFEGIVDAAFNQIRQNSRANVAVSIRLLETIGTIATATVHPGHRAHLRRHADLVAKGALEAIPDPDDRSTIERRHDEARRATIGVVAAGKTDRSANDRP
jgi:uncharacterized membrane protein